VLTHKPQISLNRKFTSYITWPLYISASCVGTDADVTQCSGSLLLELCRIAQELEMPHLEGLAVEAFCHLSHLSFVVDEDAMEAQGQGERDVVEMAQKIAGEQRGVYLQRALGVCEDWALNRMHVAVMFLLENGEPMVYGGAPLVDYSLSSSTRHHRHTSSSSSSSSRNIPTGVTGSPTGLHRQVMASVHDVNMILEQQPQDDDEHEDEMNERYTHSDSDDIYHEENQDDHLAVGFDDVYVAPPVRRPSAGSSSGGQAKSAAAAKGSRGPPQKTGLGGKRQKPSHPRPGGIYKLLLEEQAPESGAGPVDIASSPVPARATTSSKSAASKRRASGQSAGGDPMEIQEFVRSEHSLQPRIDPKKTDAQKR
jgi:hypothetical protein